MLKEKLNPVINPVNKQISCMDGTRDLILQDLCNWVLKPDSCMAWICGLAGSGKSAIAVTLAEKLRDLKDQVTLALTFHCVKGLQTSDTSILVPTIGYHLAKAHPEYAQALLDVLEKDVSLHVDSIPLKEQLSVICKPLYTIKGTNPTIIIIDGLDEWGKPLERSTLLAQLQEHFNQIQWIRVIVTSRPNSEIQKAMIDDDHVQLFDLTAKYTAHKDIEIFFRKRFAEFDYEISNNDINNLVLKADGLFIWANTAVEFIDSGLDMSANIQIVLQLQEHDSDIEHPHAKLHDLYREVLKQYFTNKQSQLQCQIIVGLIVSAYEPLTVNTLAAMLRLGSSVTYPVVKKVVAILKAVLYLNNGKVYYHQSLAEFLSSEQCPEEFKIQKTSQHQNLARICLEVQMTELKFNICNLETSSILNQEIKDLEKRIDQCISSQLRYSAQWWAHHVASTEATNVIVTMVTDFTSSGLVIFWLECMSLIGKVNGIMLSAGEIKKWAQKIKDTNMISRMQELEQFTHVFSIPLLESTPHLYVSGCALLPSESLLQEKKIMHLKQIVKVASSGHVAKWAEVLHAIHVGNKVNSVAYSPNGQYVVAGSDDNTVRIMNAQTGVQVGEPLKGHTELVWAVAYSPDSQYIVSSSRDGTVRIWNAETGMQVIEPIFGHTMPDVTSVAYSPDGQYVVSGSADQTVRIWNTETGVQVGKPLFGHTRPVWSVAYSPDGQYVASGSTDNTVRIWNAQTGLQVMEPLQAHTDCAESVAYSPDGQYVVSGSRDSTVRIWNAQTGVQVGEPLKGHLNDVLSVAYSPDSHYVVSGSKDTTIKIWDAETGVEVGKQLTGHTDSVTSVAYSPDGQYLVSGSEDNSVRIWNAPTGVQVRNPLKGTSTWITSVAYSPNGQYVVSGSGDNTVRIWNAQTGVQVGEPLKGHTHYVTSVAYSPDGQYVVSGSEDNTVRVWNVQTGVQVGEPLKGHTKCIFSVAYSPNGQHVVSGSWDTTVRIWNAQTGEQVGEPLQGHTNVVCIMAVAHSPDGQYVVHGSALNTITIWNAQTGFQVSKTFKGHTGGVRSVAYSADGQYVVSGSLDNTVRIWNAQTGVQVGEPFIGHTQSVSSVAYSPNGQYVVSGSVDGTIRIWDAGVQNESTLANCNLHLPQDISSGYIDNQGWLRSKAGLLILWLPPSMRHGFEDKRQLLTIPNDAANCALLVDWSNFVHGAQWTECWDST
ncbi:hypothetical protein GYMLUDRAFT_174907 [Collybiopsis luxurians FD-317 M1]|uniref:NACHT domain-containing protein n=1 Tax=Collybiopsis luxurians FD-317 M1 TaxID=944289 RepID=A0A0D0AZ99_9AGAR|nr:hypothetical protein GYMLUDRAFT_174907 [Collybiopsis luxurians FD-317 M1]